MDKKLSEEAYSVREREADAYSQMARRAFLDGYEAAVEEASEFTHLRAWLEQQRDNAHEGSRDAHGRGDEMTKMARFGERMAFTEVLTKLSQIGVHSEDISEGITAETISSHERKENDEQ